MKRFALFICIGSIILLILGLIMACHNWDQDQSLWNQDRSIWGNILLSIAMTITAYSTYISYKKYK